MDLLHITVHNVMWQILNTLPASCRYIMSHAEHIFKRSNLIEIMLFNIYYTCTYILQN